MQERNQTVFALASTHLHDTNKTSPACDMICVTGVGDHLEPDQTLHPDWILGNGSCGHPRTGDQTEPVAHYQDGEKSKVPDTWNF